MVADSPALKWCLLEKLVDKYPIFFYRGRMAENDWSGWKALTDEIGGRVQLVGDDLFVTKTSFCAADRKRA